MPGAGPPTPRAGAPRPCAEGTPAEHPASDHHTVRQSHRPNKAPANTLTMRHANTLLAFKTLCTTKPAIALKAACFKRQVILVHIPSGHQGKKLSDWDTSPKQAAHRWRLSGSCCGQASPGCPAHAWPCRRCLVLAHSGYVCWRRALNRQGDDLIAAQQDQPQHSPDITLHDRHDPKDGRHILLRSAQARLRKH